MKQVCKNLQGFCIGGIAMSVILMTGCSQNVAKFSVATTGNLSLPSSLSKGKTIEGKDCITRFFGIPFGNTKNRVSNAVGKALDEAAKKGEPSDALVNVDIRSSYWSIIIFGRQCIIAKGQPVGKAIESSTHKKEE